MKLKDELARFGVNETQALTSYARISRWQGRPPLVHCFRHLDYRSSEHLPHGRNSGMCREASRRSRERHWCTRNVGIPC